MKRVYISVPVTSQDCINQKNHVFNVSTDLAIKGYSVRSCFDAVSDIDLMSDECVAKCMLEVLRCDAIYLCRGWQRSKQCMAEVLVAMNYDKEVMTE